MDNAHAAEKLNLFGLLLELSDSNPFRVRAFHNAGRALAGLSMPFAELVQAGTITEIQGIGKGVAALLSELHETGSIRELQTLLEQTPAGIMQMRQVPGLGAKKLRQLYKECRITSLDQLEAACQDGTLAALSGFGARSVAKIQDGINQVRSFAGQWRRPKAQKVAQSVRQLLLALPEVSEVYIAGALRRELETIDYLDWVVCGAGPRALVKTLSACEDVESVDVATSSLHLKLVGGLTGHVTCVDVAEAGNALFEATGPEDYVGFVHQHLKGHFADEAQLMKAAGLPLLPPECRDLEAFWIQGAPADLLRYEDLRGVLHCHSTYSDGRASLRDMVEQAALRGLTYFGICDHSKSAGYAGGLSVERVAQQHAEIEKLNVEFAGRIRIFKGIESDILVDGSLDYPEAVLETFDFVVASVHSGLDMDEKTATERVCKAIRNPYTTILGHSTGRLLLERRGFPLDMRAVVAALKESGVVIEHNANPRRLDVDWRHLPDIFEAGVKTSINPDAHTPLGLDDMHHGVAVARKAGTRPSQVLNGMEADELARYFKKARG